MSSVVLSFSLLPSSLPPSGAVVHMFNSVSVIRSSVEEIKDLLEQW